MLPQTEHVLNYIHDIYRVVTQCAEQLVRDGANLR